MLASDPRIDVVAYAYNGRQAVELPWSSTRT